MSNIHIWHNIYVSWTSILMQNNAENNLSHGVLFWLTAHASPQDIFCHQFYLFDLSMYNAGYVQTFSIISLKWNIPQAY